MKKSMMSILQKARRRPLSAANALTAGASGSLLLGAIAFQHLMGLIPCEMCMWQRWPHLAAVVLAMLAIPLKDSRIRRTLVAASAGGLATSGMIAIEHLGVERHWWEGHTACTAHLDMTGGGADFLNRLMNMPLHRCDVAQWKMAGLSLADLNAGISISTAVAAAWLIAMSLNERGN
jgi:disulfide bond formation protein DsbB